MNLLIFAGMYHPFRGGYFESIHGLATRLTEHHHTVHILTCNTHHSAYEEVMDGITITRLDCYNPSWLANTFPIPLPTRRNIETLRKLLEKPWHVISTQTRFFTTTWLGVLVAKWKRLPIIHTERGATHSVAASPIISFCAKTIDHTFGWCVVRFADTVIGVSREACKFTRHLGAKKPIVIYNGVDVSWWNARHEIHTKLPRNEEGDTVLTFTGRLVYAKGVQDLLYAVAKLDNQAIKLNIIGDGAYKCQLIALAEQLHISERVQFWGEMTRDQIRDILHQTDIFVNPSHSEGLPRSVLEAAAVGLPIIATDTGGTNEIIGESRGLLVPPRDPRSISKALTILLSDQDLRRSMGANAQSYVAKHFNWEGITRQYITECERLCAV